MASCYFCRFRFSSLGRNASISSSEEVKSGSSFLPAVSSWWTLELCSAPLHKGFLQEV